MSSGISKIKTYYLFKIQITEVDAVRNDKEVTRPLANI